MAKYKRTIKHPGFEFFETTQTALTSGYVQNTEALTIGFFARGPIGVPIRIYSLDQLTTVFGEPRNEAEFYSYKGIESIINRGRTITVIRMPYDNSMSALKATDPVLKTNFDLYHKILKGNFEIAEGSSGKYMDIAGAFESNPAFKTISLEPDLVSEADIVSYSAENFSSDFVIVNQYNNEKLSDGTEYFVCILGTGNVLREQELSKEASSVDEINYFATGGGSSLVFTEDDKKLYFSKDRAKWQTTGDQISTGVDETIADVYDQSILGYFQDVAVDEKYSETLVKGIPTHIISFTTGTKGITFDQTTGEPIESEMDVEIPSGYAPSISYNTTNASGTIWTEAELDTLPKTLDIKNAVISVKTLPNIDVVSPTSDEYARTVTYLLTFVDPETKETLKTYNLSRVYTEDISNPVQWQYTIQSEYDKPAGFNYYINRDQSHNISVIVSKISPSELEKGRFQIEPVEAFYGSIFKNSINPISGESDYIGNIINSNSNIIKFYGKKTYSSYNKDEDCILVEGLKPYSLSIRDGSYYSETSEQKYDLSPILKKASNKDLSHLNILDELLKKVQNNVVHTYRDVYDFGLSSVLTYQAPDSLTGNYYYDPRYSATEIAGSEYIQAYTWKAIVRKFAKHCENNHKLSMFHADGPRKLLLNGDLSRTMDLKHDEEEVVLTSRKLQSLSIRDCSYIETNIQWYEMYNEFQQINEWIPSSIQLASNITYNDISNAIWDAPAGHKYGVVSSQVLRPAINPTYDTQDKIYTNNLNYGIAWPNGVITIEGQKTGISVDSALNRINVRRLMVYLEKLTKFICVKYQYQPNDSGTRSALVAELAGVYSSIRTKGGLYNYRIVCDSTNNPSSVIDANELRLTIMVQPVRTLEFIVCHFFVAKTSSNLTEITVQ